MQTIEASALTREPGHAVRGVGIDVCAVGVVEATLRAHPITYPAEVLSAAELRDVVPDAADLALAFAVKEAVTKALRPAPTRPWRWSWVEVHRGCTGVAVVLHSGAATLAAERGITDVTACAALAPSASGNPYDALAVATAIAC